MNYPLNLLQNDACTTELSPFIISLVGTMNNTSTSAAHVQTINIFTDLRFCVFTSQQLISKFCHYKDSLPYQDLITLLSLLVKVKSFVTTKIKI